MFKVVSSTRKNRGEYIAKIAKIGLDVGSMFTRKSNPPVPPASAVDRMDQDLFISNPPVPTAPPVDEIGVTMVSGPGKLLMISDLEGCTSKGNGKDQSRAMCEQTFFVAIKTFLDANVYNKVAFLGDYFDQGEFVLSTIYAMVQLKKKYKDRVYIILGNRDINKLRLMFELPEDIQLPTKSTWTTWNKPGLFHTSMKEFYDKDFEGNKEVRRTEKLKLIYAKSMGVPVAPRVIVDGEVYDEVKSNYMLLRSLKVVDEDVSLQNPQDVELMASVEQLFRMSKIVIYDEDFKVLLSHAGGADVTAFHSKGFYDAIEEAFNQMFDGSEDAEDYYLKMDFARQCLQNTAKSKYLLTQDLDPTHYPIETFDPDVYNQPLSDVVELLFGPVRPKAIDLPCKYFIVSALGQRPDDNSGNLFASFVNTCNIVQGCKGPSSLIPNEGFPELLAKFGIGVVAHGHVPHCTPIPIIYQTGGIVFIGNDTSNGNRPASLTRDLVPLSYITRDGKVGIMGVTSADASAYQTKFSELTDPGVVQFAPMIGEWSLANVPPVMVEGTCPTITYGSKKLGFPDCVDHGVNPSKTKYMAPRMVNQGETIEPTPIAPPAPIVPGGRYKRTHKRKRTKRRGQKKRVTRKRL